MNYAFTKACLDAFAFGTLDATGFAEKLNELLMRNTDTVNGMMLNLLDSHDTHRFLTQAGGDIQKLGCALAVLYLFVRRSLSLCRRAVHLLRHGDRHGGRVRPRLPPHDGLGTRGGTAAPLAARAAACRFETGKRRPARDEGKNMGGRRSLLSGTRRNKQAAAHRQFRERAAADRQTSSINTHL